MSGSCHSVCVCWGVCVRGTGDVWGRSVQQSLANLTEPLNLKTWTLGGCGFWGIGAGVKCGQGTLEFGGEVTAAVDTTEGKCGAMSPSTGWDGKTEVLKIPYLLQDHLMVTV